MVANLEPALDLFLDDFGVRFDGGAEQEECRGDVLVAQEFHEARGEFGIRAVVEGKRNPLMPCRPFADEFLRGVGRANRTCEQRESGNGSHRDDWAARYGGASNRLWRRGGGSFCHL